MKIWTGKLTLNGERKKAGVEVDAKIAIGDSGAIIFEVRGIDGWAEGEPTDVYAPSWLRALAETGKEVP